MDLAQRLYMLTFLHINYSELFLFILLKNILNLDYHADDVLISSVIRNP